MRTIASVLILGTLVAVVVAIFHITGSVQLFGADGVVLPSWLILVLAVPTVAVAQLLLVVSAGLQRRRSAGR